LSVKICVVGCGAHAVRVHGPSYKKYKETYPDTILAACCDIDPVKAESFKAAFGFQAFYTDMDSMLEQEKPDAVCLLVKEPLIAPLSVKIMNKGFPVLIEKPPGLNREETLSMISAAKTNQLYHKVAFNRWYAPLMLKLKQLMRDHVAVGDIHQIRYDFYRVGRKSPDFATTAIHAISAVAFIADSPFKTVRFTYQELPGVGDKVANFYLECEFQSGVLAHLHICPLSGVTVERATVNALNHTFYLELPIWNDLDYPGRLIHIQAGQMRSEIKGDSAGENGELFMTNGFFAENEAFFNAIREGRGTGQLAEGDLHIALQIVEIADCLRLRKSEYTSIQ
jgi:myo-inositol 2-dehydrogenase/D-chiro-inositol 1-dehydrogenase